MPMLSNITLHMELIADLKLRGTNHIAIGKDMEEKARNMLAYAQCHCEHEFSKPLPAFIHEGGNCKHCGVNEQYAPTARKNWLAMEADGTAPWGPRIGSRPAKTKTLAGIAQSDTATFTRDDQ